jgi:hypothetical protein
MPNQPQQPLDELEALRSDVRRLHSMLTEESTINEQLRAEKQRLWDALRSTVNLLELDVPTSEYRQQVLNEALKSLYPETYGREK